MNIDSKYFKEISFELIAESTLQDLTTSTDTAFPNRSDKVNNVRITNKSYEQYDSDKLLVKARCAGETSDYETSLLFEGVQFVENGNPQSITLAGGLNILPLSMNQNTVKVKCTCLDFHWTFAWQNSGDGSLIGDPPPAYQSTTDRPPRNPTDSIGLCKHLLKLKSDIQAEGLIE